MLHVSASDLGRARGTVAGGREGEKRQEAEEEGEERQLLEGTRAVGVSVVGATAKIEARPGATQGTRRRARCDGKKGKEWCTVQRVGEAARRGCPREMAAPTMRWQTETSQGCAAMVENRRTRKETTPAGMFVVIVDAC
jgi:hypothetical protein